MSDPRRPSVRSQRALLSQKLLAAGTALVIGIAAAQSPPGGMPPSAAASAVTTPSVTTPSVTTPSAATPSVTTPGAAPAGVANPQRAWQNWTLNCQGCHRPDGTGSEGTAPSLAGTVSKFLTVPGGREYLGRVPGVATSPLSNADLADVMNWMFWRFDKEHMPANFSPFTAEEIGRLRTQPLRLEASQMRNELLKQADESAAP
jgi:cytochrome c553